MVYIQKFFNEQKLKEYHISKFNSNYSYEESNDDNSFFLVIYKKEFDNTIANITKIIEISKEYHSNPWTQQYLYDNLKNKYNFIVFLSSDDKNTILNCKNDLKNNGIFAHIFDMKKGLKTFIIVMMIMIIINITNHMIIKQIKQIIIVNIMKS